MGRHRSDSNNAPDLLARRAAAGDIEAAKRLVRVLGERAGTPVTTLPDDVIGLALEAFAAVRLLLEEFDRNRENGYRFWQPGGQGYEALALAKLASIALERPNHDWKHKMLRIRMLATRRTCRHCGQDIFDMREESGADEADWATADGDFGCTDSPDTIYPGDDPEAPEDFGAGSHEPEE